MNYYDEEIIRDLTNQQFAFIAVEENENVLTICLDREEKRNAIHPHMVNELAFVLQYANHQKDVWAIKFKAKGKVFCAGADLKAFMGMLGEYESSIPEPNQPILMAELFFSVHKPIIAMVEGDVYAGGFFFLTGSTYVLANKGVKFGLPEVKRGLYPFQVMETLLRVMPQRKVIDWCIRGYNLSVEKALEYGLVTHVIEEGEMEKQADQLINDLKENSPSAIRLGLEAFRKIQKKEGQHEYLMAMLQKTVGSKDGQEGLTAFREKRKPNWTGE